MVLLGEVRLLGRVLGDVRHRRLGGLLWHPELSSYIVPGWVLNVATLVHSEEALLAALFIFTVHFFNTHFVPDKFPMDRLIFTGTYSMDDLKRDRPVEYERLMARAEA